MGEVIFDRAFVLRPVQPIHPELRALELFLGLSDIGKAEHHEGRVTEENEPPIGSQETRGFGNPPIGVGPERGAVLRVNEVERGVRKRHVLGEGLDQRKDDPELGLHASRGFELGGSGIDADNSGPTPGKPR